MSSGILQKVFFHFTFISFCVLFSLFHTGVIYTYIFQENIISLMLDIQIVQAIYHHIRAKDIMFLTYEEVLLLVARKKNLTICTQVIGMSLRELLAYGR